MLGARLAVGAPGVVRSGGFAGAAAAHEPGAERDQGREHQQCHDDRGEHHGGRIIVLRVVRRGRVRNTMPAHEQSMRVHAVWRAGYERGEVRRSADVQCAQVVRQDHFDLIDLVRVGVVEYVECEGVAFFQLIQTSE